MFNSRKTYKRWTHANDCNIPLFCMLTVETWYPSKHVLTYWKENPQPDCLLMTYDLLKLIVSISLQQMDRFQWEFGLKILPQCGSMPLQHVLNNL